jgi:hypothetical protein
MCMGIDRDYALTGDEHAREVVVKAAESLVDRFSEGVSIIPLAYYACGTDFKIMSGRLYKIMGWDERWDWTIYKRQHERTLLSDYR